MWPSSTSFDVGLAGGDKRGILAALALAVPGAPVQARPYPDYVAFWKLWPFVSIGRCDARLCSQAQALWGDTETGVAQDFGQVSAECAFAVGALDC